MNSKNIKKKSKTDSRYTVADMIDMSQLSYNKISSVIQPISDKILTLEIIEKNKDDLISCQSKLILAVFEKSSMSFYGFVYEAVNSILSMNEFITKFIVKGETPSQDYSYSKLTRFFALKRKLDHNIKLIKEHLQKIALSLYKKADDFIHIT